VREVLRHHTTAWSAREVASTTALSPKPPASSPSRRRRRTYELQKGAVVALPSSLLHHDASVHAGPRAFDAARFLAAEHGGVGTPVSSATLRPFGGGASYCPGRLFAEKQVVGVLAAVVVRYEVGVEAGGWEVPRNADFFYVTKQRDVVLGLRRR
jgi:cytochrome P450